MTPIRPFWFNSTLRGGPAEQYGCVGDVDDLPVDKNGETITSCWRPSFHDRIALLFGARVWLRVLAKDTHPPVMVTVE